MKLFKLAKNFRNDEDGAVTVDWVVLTAALVGLAIAVLTSIGGKVTAAGDTAGGNIDAAGTLFDSSGSGTGN